MSQEVASALAALNQTIRALTKEIKELRESLEYEEEQDD